QPEPAAGLIVRLRLIVLAGHDPRHRGAPDRAHLGHGEHQRRRGEHPPRRRGAPEPRHAHECRGDPRRAGWQPSAHHVGDAVLQGPQCLGGLGAGVKADGRPGVPKGVRPGGRLPARPARGDGGRGGHLRGAAPGPSMRSPTSPRREPGRDSSRGQPGQPAAARTLAFPADLEERLPMDRVGAEFVARTRREIAAILAGSDDRLLVVVGPCSIHDPAAALDYAGRLAAVTWAHAGDMLVVMRTYFEKPRTVAGWKGFVNDPRLDGTFEINEGLYRARQLLLEITRLGLAAGTEFLDPLLGQFYADLISWGVIGARTVESQIHRQLASGLPMPIGFKNRTDGDVQVAVDAVRAARAGHRFPMLARSGASAVEVTRGNDQTHIILRGGA